MTDAEFERLKAIVEAMREQEEMQWTSVRWRLEQILNDEMVRRGLVEK